MNCQQEEDRRDSNTSTISSYMSSLRSDASPYPPNFGSQYSSRRSSETSQASARLSIANSPYEYDIMGNTPHAYRRCSDNSNSSVGNVTNQLQNTTLGSHPNLVVQSQMTNLRSPSNRIRNERIAHFLASHKENEGWRTSTPSRTPLPGDVPNNEVRRASDPVRCVDQNFNNLRKLQRFHSLNTMRPLPLPNSMRSLRNRSDSGSQSYHHSSQSSIVNHYGNGQEGGCGSQRQMGGDNSLIDSEEAILEMKMMEDNEDMLIPDDMRQFLNEQYHGYGPFPADSTVPDYSQCNVRTRMQMPHPPSAGQPVYNNMLPPHPPPRQQSGTAAGHTCYRQRGMNGQGWHSAPSGQQLQQQSNMRREGAGGPPCMGCQQGALCAPGSERSTPQQQHYPRPPSHPPNIQNQQQQQQQQQQTFAPHPPPQQMMQGNPPIMHQHGCNQQQPQQPQWQQGHVMHNRCGSNQCAGPCNHGHSEGVPPMGPYYNQTHHHHPAGYSGNPEQVQHKQERCSPQVQVPHISQSQIPLRAKAANRNHARLQQQQQQHFAANSGPCCNHNNQPQHFCPPMNMNNTSYPQDQSTFQPQPPVYPPQQGMATPVQQMGCQPMPPNGMRDYPSCQLTPPNQNMCNMQLSPNCNQVSSTTDTNDKLKNNNNNDTMVEDYMSTNLNSISTENLLDNITSISMENMGGTIMSPTALMNRSASQTSSRITPYYDGKMSAQGGGGVLNTSNMVVNDMSSMLTQLAEENKYLSMRP